MIKVIASWLQRYFSDPEAAALVVAIVVLVAVFMFMGNILVPIVASIVIAYILNGFVQRLEHWKTPHLLAVLVVYLLFLSGFLLLLIWLLPLLFQQLSNLFAEFPHMLTKGQKFLVDFQAHHPELFSAEQLRHFFAEFNVYLTRFGKFLLSFSLASIGNVITIVVYVILVPLLVFFFLKDRAPIVTWLLRFLPAKHQAMTAIWKEIDGKIGDYIRGKILEIIIVALVAVPAFLLLGLNYAVLLGVGVGLSVIIPYVGAISITIPVVIIAGTQWGLSAHFVYLVIVYTVIAALDANVLVPLLFSEKMKLHPVIIVLAILVFGSFWGFWGVFFAIPLATVVNALLKGWPRTNLGG